MNSGLREKGTAKAAREHACCRPSRADLPRWRQARVERKSRPGVTPRRIWYTGRVPDTRATERMEHSYRGGSVGGSGGRQRHSKNHKRGNWSHGRLLLKERATTTIGLIPTSGPGVRRCVSMSMWSPPKGKTPSAVNASMQSNQHSGLWHIRFNQTESRANKPACARAG